MCIHRTGSRSQYINDRCALAEVVFDESPHVRSPSGGSQVAALHIGCRYACTFRHNACVLASDVDMEQGRKSASAAAALAAARRKGAAISLSADTVVQLRSLLKACISITPALTANNYTHRTLDVCTSPWMRCSGTFRSCTLLCGCGRPAPHAVGGNMVVVSLSNPHNDRDHVGDGCQVDCLHCGL